MPTLMERIRNGLKGGAGKTPGWLGRTMLWLGQQLWNLGSWGGGKLMDAAQQGGGYMRKRMYGQPGVMVVHRDSTGMVVRAWVFDENKRDLRTGEPLDMEKYSFQAYRNGVPDYTCETYQLMDILPYKQVDGGPLTREQQESLDIWDPESKYNLREAYWKSLNGIGDGELTPDQRLVYDAFSRKESRRVEQTSFGELVDTDVEKACRMVRQALYGFDAQEQRNLLKTCAEKRVELVSGMSQETLDGMERLLIRSDATLENLSELARVPVTQLTDLQLLGLECIAQNGGVDATLADRILDNHDFQKEWEQHGRDAFMRGDDAVKAEWIRRAKETDNLPAIYEQAQSLFLSAFDQTSYSCSDANWLSVKELASMHIADGGLLSYFDCIDRKREYCQVFREAMEQCAGFELNPSCAAYRGHIQEMNAMLDGIYRSPDMQELEAFKLERLASLYESGQGRTADNKVNTELSEALASVFYSLSRVGQQELFFDKLSGSELLHSAELKEKVTDYGVDGTEELWSAAVERMEKARGPVALELDFGEDFQVIPEKQTDYAQAFTDAHNRYVDFVEPTPEFLATMLVQSGNGTEKEEDMARMMLCEMTAYLRGEIPAEELLKSPYYRHINTCGRPAEEVCQALAETWKDMINGEILQKDREGNRQAQNLQQHMDEMMDKYKPEANLETYAGISHTSEKGLDWLRNSADGPLRVEMANQCVAMAMGYRDKLVGAEEFLYSLSPMVQDRSLLENATNAEPLAKEVLKVYRESLTPQTGQNVDTERTGGYGSRMRR